jgi:hypothetical protein
MHVTSILLHVVRSSTWLSLLSRVWRRIEVNTALPRLSPAVSPSNLMVVSVFPPFSIATRGTGDGAPQFFAVDVQNKWAVPPFDFASSGIGFSQPP